MRICVVAASVWRRTQAAGLFLDSQIVQLFRREKGGARTPILLPAVTVESVLESMLQYTCFAPQLMLECAVGASHRQRPAWQLSRRAEGTSAHFICAFVVRLQLGSSPSGLRTRQHTLFAFMLQAVNGDGSISLSSKQVRVLAWR